MTKLGVKITGWFKKIRFKIWLFFVVHIRPWFRVQFLLWFWIPLLDDQQPKPLKGWFSFIRWFLQLSKIGYEKPMGPLYGWWLVRVLIALILLTLIRGVALLLDVRPLVLLIVVVCVYLGFHWLIEAGYMGEVFAFIVGKKNGIGENPPSPDWDTVGTQLFLLRTSPILFILWYWRDHNVRMNLENERKDTNLKDFQETQMRAAGAIGGNFKPERKLTLQIAALHHLRAFLRGDHGESFRRPAYELFRAQLETSARDMGHDKITNWLNRLRRIQRRRVNQLKQITLKMIAGSVVELRKRIDKESPGPLQRAERQILVEDCLSIFRSDFSLTSFQIPGVEFPEHTMLAKLQLENVNMRACKLKKAHLEGANLWLAHLEDINLVEAYLEGAELIGTHLEGASLKESHLEGAILDGAYCEGASLISAHLKGASLAFSHFEGANFNGAHLEGANLWEANLRGADLRNLQVDETTNFIGAVYNDKTQFGVWDNETKKIINVDEERKKLEKLGLRHVNEERT